MANVISSFLVGIGLDFDSKGAKEAESSISSIGSTALQAGAALAGAFGLKSLTADFASAYDELGKFSDVFGLVPNDVAAMGSALEHEGGSLDSFMNQMAGLEKMRAGLLKGDAGFISQAGMAGIDPSVITNADNATDAYLALADQFERMSGQERLNAADALGLDEASIRLLSKGRDAVEDVIDAEKKMRPVNEEMTEASARFNDEWQDLWTRIGGATDTAAMKILPAVTDVIAGIGDWMDTNDGLIDQGIGEIFGFIADNLGKIATAGALLGAGGMLKTLSGMSKMIPVIGGSIGPLTAGLGKLAGVAGAVTAAAEGGWAIGTMISENLSEETNLDLGRGIAKTLAFFGHEDSKKALAAEEAAGGFTDAGRPTVVTPEAAGAMQRTDPMFSASNAMSKGAEVMQKSSDNKKPIVLNNNLSLDGKPFRDMIINVSDEQSEQTLKDISSPFEG